MARGSGTDSKRGIAQRTVMEMDVIFRKRGRHVTRKIAGETVIVPVSGHVGDLDAIYVLNDVAQRIWDLVDGRTAAGAVVDAILDEFDTTREEAERDVLEFVASIREAGLVEMVMGV